jgi:hypothetical protein
LFSGTRLLTWAIAVTLACGAVGLSAPEFASARIGAEAAAPADHQVARDGVPAAAPATVVHRVCHHHICNVCHNCNNCHKDHCKKGDRGDRGERGPRGFTGLPGRTAGVASVFVPNLPNSNRGGTFIAVARNGTVLLRDPRASVFVDLAVLPGFPRRAIDVSLATGPFDQLAPVIRPVRVMYRGKPQVAPIPAITTITPKPSPTSTVTVTKTVSPVVENPGLLVTVLDQNAESESFLCNLAQPLSDVNIGSSCVNVAIDDN